MTIDKAITRLQQRIEGEFYIEGVDQCEDMKLGIEALKYFKMRQTRIHTINKIRLPGETEE